MYVCHNLVYYILINMDLKELIRKVNKPARYINQEEGSIHKDWQKIDLKCCICFPDKYEIGMSNKGLEILYFLGNDQENVLVERCFAPEIDMMNVLNDEKIPLFSLESKNSLKNFDVLCFSLPKVPD